MSLHVAQFYQAFPHIRLELQETNAGVKRPGYKAMCVVVVSVGKELN